MANLGPAMDHNDRGAAFALGLCEAVVALVADDLQNAVEASQERFAVFSRAAASIMEHHAWWACSVRLV